MLLAASAPLPLNTAPFDDDFVAEMQRGIALFDSAYDAWSDSLFQRSEAHFAAMTTRYPESPLPPYWRGVALFHLVSYSLFGLPEDRNTDAAKAYIGRALASLEQALRIDPDDVESLALVGTLNGIRIHLNPLQAPLLGPRVLSSLERATAEGKSNPRVHYLIGVSYYYRPGLIGGGADKALTHLLRAAELYQQEADSSRSPLSPHWGHSACLGFIGRTYEKLGQHHTARTYYEKALQVNPRDKMARAGLQVLSFVNDGARSR